MKPTKKEVVASIDNTINALTEIRIGILSGNIPQKEYPALMKDLEGE